MNYQRINEYDVVELVSCREGLQAGLQGVVLLALGDHQEVFEIEFFDGNGVSLGTATIDRVDLKIIPKSRLKL